MGPRGSLVEFFRKFPVAGTALEIGRSRDTGRLVQLESPKRHARHRFEPRRPTS